jgi:hypothetical protein
MGPPELSPVLSFISFSSRPAALNNFGGVGEVREQVPLGLSSFRSYRDEAGTDRVEAVQSRFLMTKIFRTTIEASGGVINHGVRYVLGASLTIVIVALIVAFAYR